MVVFEEQLDRDGEECAGRMPVFKVKTWTDIIDDSSRYPEPPLSTITDYNVAENTGSFGREQRNAGLGGRERHPGED
jgi:hypothetical protein